MIIVFSPCVKQDEKLKKLVEEHGTEDWNFIASNFLVSFFFSPPGS